MSTKSTPVKKEKKISPSLLPYHTTDYTYEIATDEAGRGPLFGRLYVAAVILPKDESFDHSKMKDSKKFHSKTKIKQVAEYIKEHSIAWYIHFIDETVIDTINIRQAVLKAMHECIDQCITKTTDDISSSSPPSNKYFILVDGNDFTPHTLFDETTDSLIEIPHETIEGGDNTYSAIAAASILAKTARDEYILELCEEHPELKTIYHLDTNMGYGTKEHITAIKEHGITKWHRKTYGICKSYVSP
jgi:ribonuclease HII